MRRVLVRKALVSWKAGVFLMAGGLSSCLLFESTSPRVGPRAAELLLWRDTAVKSVTRLTLDQHAVYTLARNHVVSSIDKTSGTTLWQTQLTPSVPSRQGAGIMLAAGHLIIGDIDLFALDPATGHQVWKYAPSVGAWPGWDKQWTDGSIIICGSATGHVYAVDAATGVERWVSHFVDDTNTNVYSPVVSNGTIFVGFTHFVPPPHLQKTGGVAALDAATGALRWKVLLPQSDSADETGVWSDPDAILLTPTAVLTQAADDKFFAVDRQTGSIITSLPASDFGNAFGHPTDVPSIAPARDLIIVATSDLTTITAVSATNLKPVWRVAFPFGSPTRISASADRIYSGAAAGQFAAYDPSGKLVWTINLGDLRSDRQEGIVYPPAIDGDRIYVPGGREVYAFKKY